MMKLKEALKRLDKSSPEWVDLEEVGRSMGINDTVSVDQDDFDIDKARFKEYWLGSHICTDTKVGFAFLFLDNICVGYSQQLARKSEKEYNWFSRQDYNKVRNYILSKLDIDYYNPNRSLECDIKDVEYFKDGYYHSYEVESLNLVPVPQLTLVDENNGFTYYQEELEYLQHSRIMQELNGVGIEGGHRNYVFYLDYKKQIPFCNRVIKEAMEQPNLFNGDDVSISYKVVGPITLS